MRLFLAVELSADLKEALCAVVRHAAAEEVASWGGRIANWVRSENLHITLKFLGEVSEPSVLSMRDDFRRVTKTGGVTLNTAGPLFFPPRGAVRVIACDVGGNVEPLVRLRGELDEVCQAYGVQRDNRPFHPHITLGRARRDVTIARQTIQRFAPLTSLPQVEFTASEWVLYESTLLPSGPIYRAIERFAL